MFRKFFALLLSALMICSLAACGNTSSKEENNSSENNTSAQEQADAASPIGTVANTLAEDEDTLIATYADRFEQKTYTDPESGLSITYNLYLPEGYDESASYPMVVFIADSSCTGDDPARSLTQGRGGLVWAAEEWQSVHPTIVAVPTYPETILDDHSGYTTTEYVELTKRYIDYMSSEYAVDTNRIYGTGQSMGCMTTLILASEYPDLYAACMFVDGQWDGNWSVDELSAAAEKLFTADEDQYFISWKTGTIGADGGGNGGPGGGASYHMASFDYAYNCVAVMEWLFQQSK